MEKIIDLHVHSTFSDGTLTPQEIMFIAKERNLKAIALTDHDTLSGYNEFYRCGMENNIETICGIEFSTYAGIPEEIHIVGLFIDPKNKEINDKINSLQVLRNERNKKMIEKFNSMGIILTEEELKSESKGNIITKCHYARLLYKRGIVNSIYQAFNLYLKPGQPVYIPREHFNVEECIDIIHNAGGISILAHPTLYKLDYNKIYELSKKLKEYGLDGMEVIYSTFSEEQTIKMKEIANRLELCYSGGSDFHGENKPNISLGIGFGNLKIEYEILDKLKKRLEIISNV